MYLVETLWPPDWLASPWTGRGRWCLQLRQPCAANLCWISRPWSNQHTKVKG